LVSRLTQRGFVYLVAVYVLDPNLRPLAPPFIRFENGVAEIVGKYLGDVFFALNFDFSRHMRSPLVNWGLRSPAPRRSLSPVEVWSTGYCGVLGRDGVCGVFVCAESPA
jgi:hypothetical protein